MSSYCKHSLHIICADMQAKFGNDHLECECDCH